MAASPPAAPLPTGSCGRAGPDRRSDRLRAMKITDVTLTLFAWKDIPATSYGRHTGRFSGASDLGLVTLRTDDGLEGHAFLGSACARRRWTASR